MSDRDPALEITPIRLQKRFSQRVVVSSRGLLPTLYRAAEICSKLDISTVELHDWMRNGLPYQQDARGHLWFEGLALAGWIEQVRAAWPQVTLQPGEAYCLRCRKAVPMVNPTERQEGRHVLSTSRCPICGCIINRGDCND